jgi:PAS domain S-box-containing protein
MSTKSQKRSPIQTGRHPDGRPDAELSSDSRSSGPDPKARSPPPSRPHRQGLPLGDGEIAERIRAFDWASSGLGPISNWSQPVRRAVAICVNIVSAQQEKLIAARRAQRQRVTELGKQNKALVDQVAEYRAASEATRLQLEVLNNIPAMAWTVTPDGRCDFVNRFYLDATGLSADYCMAPLETWKKTPDDLPPLLSGVHPEHRERASKLFWSGTRSGLGWAYEAPILHADGTYHWHLRRAVPLKDSQGNVVRFVGTCADIEELKTAQESLHNSERRLQAIVDSSPSLIFLKDAQGHYLLVNTEFERLTGMTREQIIGKSDEDVFAPQEAAAIRSNDLEVLETGAALQFEEFVQTDTGPRYSVVQKFPLFDSSGKIHATGGIATDITDRKLQEERLRTAEERARLIVDRALDAVITIDSHGAISSWSEQAEEIFGWPRSQALNRNLADTIIPPAYRDVHETGLKRFLATGEGPLLNRRIEITALHRDGHEFPVELSIAAMKLGESWAFSAFVRDLTEKKHVEEALRDARAELTRVTRLTAMGQLSASIAHEIMQPLSAIVSNSDTCLHWLTRDEPDLEKARMTAQRMARDARRASDIITHIRSLMNKAASQRALVDVNSLIQDVLELTQWELRKREVSVHMELATSIPVIMGDRVQLQQVILNLILNGMEAMMPVRDRKRILLIKSQRHEPNEVQVSFYDTGVGLDPASADHVFEAFFTTKSHGTGIGLSICRSILEAHHGRISALPRAPHGAIFQFSLPIAR